MELLTNPAWILTKNSAMRKMAEGMGSLAERMKEAVSLNGERLPGVITGSHAKLSRGENYKGLPYLMLDYPRMFGKDDTLAIRTFFWWGHFCSITLHVKGKYKELIYKNISSVTATLADHAFYHSTEGDEWNHDMKSGDDYAPITTGTSQDVIQRLRRSLFIKFSAKVELAQWSEMEEALYKLFWELLKLLVLNHD